MPPLHVLAFDSATEQLALGLHAAGRQWAHTLPGGAAASTTLLPQIHALLATAGQRFDQLDAVAFGQGPGAFTGLRTACAVAQGLALGLDKPVLPIDSLLIVAEDARAQLAGAPQPLTLWVVMDARMDEAYAALYQCNGSGQGSWQVLRPPALYTLPALVQALQANAADAIAGSALNVFGARLPLPAGTRAVPQEQDRAAALLRLALAAARRGAGIDAALALPLYLRDKVALTTQEREAAKAAKAERAGAGSA